MKTQIIILITLLSAAISTSAQKPESFSVSILQEGISFPFQKIGDIHPGLELGTSLWTKEQERSTKKINAYTGWYLHKKLENAFYIRGEYQYSLSLIKGFSLDLLGGVGYMHTFYPGSLYEINPENGEATVVKQWGRPRLLVSTGIGLTYHNNSGFEPFVKQEMAIETPFANGIPFMPHSFIKLGVNIKI